MPHWELVQINIIFLKKTKFKFTAKFKFSSVPVKQTSFDKRLNDWSIENESKNSACLRVKTLSSSVLMYNFCILWFYVPAQQALHK
jgi:hypothetical protein